MGYISREDALSDAMCVGIACQECSFLIHPVNGGCKLEEFIEALPAADVVGRKRGKWLNIEQPGVRIKGAKYCSVCKERTYSENELYDFCPHCGADMRETGNEEIQETKK